MEKLVNTFSAEQTFRLGKQLASRLPGPAVITLRGTLGAGKTQLVKGLLAGLGSPQQATSPTFALCHYYPGIVPLLHVDLYRLKSAAELPDLGLDDALEEGYALAIEWPDELELHLPPIDLAIELTQAPQSNDSRLVRLVSHSALGNRFLSEELAVD